MIMSNDKKTPQEVMRTSLKLLPGMRCLKKLVTKYKDLLVCAMSVGCNVGQTLQDDSVNRGIGGLDSS
jgi:hypothetical protein